MSKKVLIVDDSSSMRQMVTFTLQDAGYDVVQAVHGKDALVKAAQAKVDIVVTDLNMPEMDGLELIRQIKQLLFCKFIHRPLDLRRI